jgi:hypothetical protein
MTRVPRLAPFSTADIVGVDIQSVLGFGEVLHRIVATVDAELSVSKEAEDIMVAKWEAMRRGYYSDPPLASPRRERRIRDWMMRAGFPPPAMPDVLESFLTARYGTHLRVAPK